MALLQDNRAGPSRTSPSRTSWREASLNSPPLILSLVNEAATLAPFPELKGAASVALKILENTQAVKENKDAYVQLGEDSGGLIVAIWCSFKKTEYPREWLSTEMREILEDLTHTLKNICSFVEDHISKNKAMRIMHSRARKINEYREHLNYAMQKFELQSQMNINDVLLQLVRKNDQLSEQILHRNEEEDLQRATARHARDHELAQRVNEEEISQFERSTQVEIIPLTDSEDEVWHSDELEKIEKQSKDRQSELKRLRTAVKEIETAKGLKKAQQETIKSRQKTGHEEDHRGTTIQGESSKRKNNPKRHEGVAERGRNIVIEVTSEDEGVGHPAKRSSKARRKPSKSPKRQPVTSWDESSDDSVETLESPQIRRRLSGISIRVEEIENESNDDSDEPEDNTSSASRPRKNPKVNRKPRSSSSSPLRDADDWMAHINNTFMPFGWNPHGGSPMYTQNTHCDPYLSALWDPCAHHHGIGIVNSGFGNITTATISNIGNNNSVKKTYRAHSRSPGRSARD